MNRNCTILVNEKAGKFHLNAGADGLRQAISEAELDAELVTTKSKDHLRSLCRELIEAGCHVVGIAGGDGTVHEAVQELACSKTVLGIIPQGTANNFATALRLPMDLPSALRVLKEGEVRKIDLGRARREYFTESAGIGLFADALAIYGAGTNKSFLRGLYAMARVVFSMKTRRLRLTVDGEPHTERAVLLIAANTFRIGAAMPVAPSARLDDGQLDIVIIGDLHRSELIPYYRAFRAQTHGSLPKVTTAKAHELVVESRTRRNVHCDDRIIGTTPITICSLPGALSVLVDKFAPESK